MRSVLQETTDIRVNSFLNSVGISDQKWRDQCDAFIKEMERDNG